MLESGRLNRRITIQQRGPGQDEAGQPIDGWAVVARPWAWIKGQTGMGLGRQMAGDGTVATSLDVYSFRIRYRPSITASMRVHHSGNVYDIKQVRHDLAGREWTDLVCELGGNDG